MKVFPFFDLEIRGFLLYLPSKLGREVEIWYVDWVKIIDAHFFRDSTFHAIFPPLKKWFFGWSFLCFEFVRGWSPLQIKLKGKCSACRFINAIFVFFFLIFQLSWIFFLPFFPQSSKKMVLWQIFLIFLSFTHVYLFPPNWANRFKYKMLI